MRVRNQWSDEGKDWPLCPFYSPCLLTTFLSPDPYLSPTSARFLFSYPAPLRSPPPRNCRLRRILFRLGLCFPEIASDTHPLLAVPASSSSNTNPRPNRADFPVARGRYYRPGGLNPTRPEVERFLNCLSPVLTTKSKLERLIWCGGVGFIQDPWAEPQILHQELPGSRCQILAIVFFLHGAWIDSFFSSDKVCQIAPPWGLLAML